MTFTQHVTFTVTQEGLIERGTGQLPSVVKLCPPSRSQWRPRLRHRPQRGC